MEAQQQSSSQESWSTPYDSRQADSRPCAIHPNTPVEAQQRFPIVLSSLEFFEYDHAEPCEDTVGHRFTDVILRHDVCPPLIMKGSEWNCVTMDMEQQLYIFERVPQKTDGTADYETDMEVVTLPFRHEVSF